MKIILEKYNPDWKRMFNAIKDELIKLTGSVHPRVEHIGSTSVEGLSAKPIIDILLGLENERQLDLIVEPLVSQGYIYYEIYNEDMPYRRFFVKHKPGSGNLGVPGIIRWDSEVPRSTEEHNCRLAHIHAIPVTSEHWRRHIAFRDYLRKHPETVKEYQKLKEGLSADEWVDGNDYNAAKDAFIKTEEQKAVRWFTNSHPSE